MCPNANKKVTYNTRNTLLFLMWVIIPKLVRLASSVPLKRHILAHRAKIQALDSTHSFDMFPLIRKRSIAR